MKNIDDNMYVLMFSTLVAYIGIYLLVLKGLL